MSGSDNLLGWARRAQAIAQTGLAYTKDPFDRQRYLQLQELVTELLAEKLQLPPDAVRSLWAGETGYATPKVDVRGAVFRGDQVLLVRERSDGRWTLPGGWVDIDEAPSQAVEREIREESGYEARALKLAALVDKNRHPHPRHPPHLQAHVPVRTHRRQPGAQRGDRRGGLLRGAGAAGALHRAHTPTADPAPLPAPAAAGAADGL